MTNDKPKVLILDIETAPLLVYVWGIHDQNIGLSQIFKDWHVMAWAAKWLDSPASQTMYMSQEKAKDLQNDKAILEPLWKLLDEADVVITQNGKNFDGPRLNARFIMHGMKPPSPYRHFDTYQLIKSVAKFTSHSLEYLSDKLNKKYKKLSHKKFPGWSLWIQCLSGNKDAWAEMKTYNIHDVLATEELATVIRAWAPAKLPALHSTDKCGTCGKGPLQKRGIMLTKKKRFIRFQCQNCGKWSKGKEAL